MKLRAVTAILLAALCLLLCACSAESGGKPERVTLWCLEDDPLCLALEELVQEYNRNPGKWQQVSLRVFPDEESLAAAFDTARPDLLLCSHDRAWTLEQQELFRDLSGEMGAGAPDYPEELCAVPEDVGRGYFPLGVRVTLLCVREELDEDWADLQALCDAASAYARETGSPFFTADSFGDLMYQELLRQGVEFHGDPIRDGRETAYIEAYNALAGAAFDRGLTLTEQGAAPLAAAGELPCAAAASTQMRAVPEEGFVLRALPGVVEGAPLLATSSGLAVTAREGRDLGSAAAFVRWLFSDSRAARAALDAGLIPAVSDGETAPETALQELLLELGAEHPLHLLPPKGDYEGNRAAFEESFRAVLRRFL